MNQNLREQKPAIPRLRATMFKVVVCGYALTALVACGSGGASDTIEKAQIAVRANPSLELVATDDRQGVLTVRVVRTGAMMTVNAADVVAGTAFRGLDATAAAAAAAPATASESTEKSAAPAQRTEPPASAQQRITAANERGQVTVTRSGGALTVQSGDSRVGVAGAAVSAERPLSAAPPAAAPEERAQAAPAPAPAEPAARPAQDTAKVESTAPQKGAVLDESRLEKRNRPVSCVGSQTVNLTDVLLSTDGIAVAVTGCTVHIRNSHVKGQIGLQVAGGGTVTIENSIIEGTMAMQLTPGANVSVKSSTIRGQVQRVGVNVNDQGGNVWR
jgi:hypothetical protein